MYDWDDKKDAEKRAQYGFGFSEVEQVFNQAYYQEESDSYANQYRVVGFASTGDLVTVACEDRTDISGNEYTYLATFWKASPSERKRYDGQK